MTPDATNPTPRPQDAPRRLPGRLESKLEELLARQILSLGLTSWFQREYQFAAPRRWRFDFAAPVLKLGVEVEGGIWSRGRHVRGGGFEKDAEKYNNAAILGWRVLRFTERMIKTGQAAKILEKLVNEQC